MAWFIHWWDLCYHSEGSVATTYDFVIRFCFFSYIFFAIRSLFWPLNELRIFWLDLFFVDDFWFKIFLHENHTSRRVIWIDAMLICLHNTCLPLWLASERKHYLSFPIFSNIIFFCFLSCLRLAHVLPLSWSLVFLQDSDLRGTQWVRIARWFTGLRSERAQSNGLTKFSSILCSTFWFWCLAAFDIKVRSSSSYYCLPSEALRFLESLFHFSFVLIFCLLNDDYKCMVHMIELWLLEQKSDVVSF